MDLTDLVDNLIDTEFVSAVQIFGICLDSRLANSGDLYLAVRGAQTHGLLFANDAIARGVVAVAVTAGDQDRHHDLCADIEASNIALIEIPELENHIGALAARFYRDPSQHLRVVAVTGTDGKTSVCRFIAQSLQALGEPCGYIGTLGWGLHEPLSPTRLTTPDPVSIQRMLACLQIAGASAVAIEASSHGLQQERFRHVAVDIAVLTNFGRDHLDYHQDISAYRSAKMKLFALPTLHAMVVNQQDELGQNVIAANTQKKCVCAFAVRRI